MYVNVAVHHKLWEKNMGYTHFSSSLFVCVCIKYLASSLFSPEFFPRNYWCLRKSFQTIDVQHILESWFITMQWCTIERHIKPMLTWVNFNINLLNSETFQLSTNTYWYQHFLFRQKRDEIVVATKVRGPMGPKPNDVGNSRRHIIKSIEDSLERLQTDYVDLFQVFGRSSYP